jgi:hypothetical protein
MKLSWFYDVSREFNKLTQVTFLSPFLIDFFSFNFIFQQWLDWKLGFIIRFDLFLWGYYNLIT